MTPEIIQDGLTAAAQQPVRPEPQPDRQLVAAAVERFLAIADLTSIVADALDVVGVASGCVPGHVLTPLGRGRRICGPAVTLRYVAEQESVAALRAAGERPRLGHQAIAAASRPGDVAVIDCAGHHDVAVIGGTSGTHFRDAGLAGCIVDGSVRDLEELAELGLPIWSRGRSPRAALHRLRTAEVGGRVSLAEVSVCRGDLVLADDTGVVIVPAERIADVLNASEQIVAAEAAGAAPERSALEGPASDATEATAGRDGITGAVGGGRG